MNEVCKNDGRAAMTEKNRTRKKKSGRTLSARLPVIGKRRASVLAGGIMMGMYLMPVAHAVDFTINNATELMTDAGTADVDPGDPDPTHNTRTSYTLGANITNASGTAMPVTSIPIILDFHTLGHTLTLDGAGTAWDSGSYTSVTFFDGVAGTDSLVLTNGATFHSRRSTAANPGIFAFQVGNLRVDGNGSNLIVDTDFVVGRGGDVNISLTNGGHISTARTYLGEEVNTLATSITLHVDGSGTLWDAGELFTAGGGANNVDVTLSGGATIQGDPSGYTAIIGRSGPATLLVTGVGSRFDTGTFGELDIGTFFASTGSGAVTISNGGLVSALAVVIAQADSSVTGTLLVNSGSVLETGGLIYFPGTGTASVTFDNGTLRAIADSFPGSVLIYGFSGTQLNIGPGGMFLDSNGFYTVSSSVMSGVGGLTKQGDGIFNLTASNTYLGPTLVSRGTLQAGIDNAFSAASVHTVATGATLDTGGFNQVIAGLDNSGTVTLVGTAPGSTLRVTGNYVGHAGVLKLGTALGDSSSISDRLVIDGPGTSASGNTAVQITNLGGLGAQTTGNGIEVISGINGATTTAQTTKSAFSLAGGHVDAGAYEYRLFAADANGAGENWYLRSSTPAAGGGTAPVGGGIGPGRPIRPPVVAFRREVPLLAALPQHLRQGGMTMLSNLHQRVGDNNIHDGSQFADQAGQREAWGRIISVDNTMSLSGTVSPGGEGRLTGFQAGTDLWANAHWHTGLYVGQLDGDMSVTGFASGVENASVGSNSVRSQFFGAYATYRNGRGIYVDTVLQAEHIRYDSSATGTAANNGSGSSLLASVEVGKSFEISPRWRIEPQLQLAHQSIGMDSLAISGAQVDQGSDSNWIVRAGLRVKGEFSTGASNWQPYGRVNLYRSNTGTDITRFTGPAGTTDIATRTGGTSSELVAGGTVQLNNRLSLYGEVGKMWATSDTVRLGSGVNGSIGAKMLW